MSLPQGLNRPLLCRGSRSAFAGGPTWRPAARAFVAHADIVGCQRCHPNRHYECLRHLGGEERDERDQHGRGTRSHWTHRRRDLQGFDGTRVSRAQHPNRSNLIATRTDRTARTRQ